MPPIGIVLSDRKVDEKGMQKRSTSPEKENQLSPRHLEMLITPPRQRDVSKRASFEEVLSLSYMLSTIRHTVHECTSPLILHGAESSVVRVPQKNSALYAPKKSAYPSSTRTLNESVPTRGRGLTG